MNSVDDLCESFYVLFYSNMFSFGWLDKWLYLSFQRILTVPDVNSKYFPFEFCLSVYCIYERVLLNLFEQ